MNPDDKEEIVEFTTLEVNELGEVKGKGLGLVDSDEVRDLTV